MLGSLPGRGLRVGLGCSCCTLALGEDAGSDSVGPSPIPDGQVGALLSWRCGGEPDRGFLPGTGSRVSGCLSNAQGEPCPFTLFVWARGQWGCWPSSPAIHSELCHLVLPITGSGCSCGTGDLGRSIPSRSSPIAPALPPLAASWPWIHPHELCQVGLGAQGAVVHPGTWAHTMAGHGWAQPTPPGVCQQLGWVGRGFLPAAQPRSIGRRRG